MNRLLLSILFTLIFLFSLNQKLSASNGLVTAEYGMVASQESLASQIGVDILKAGGNAVDAAVAVGYALAVTLPEAGNIGGGGFMLVHLAKENKTIAINYREKAPILVHRDMFLDKNKQVDTYKIRDSLYSTGIPGTVAGLNLAQQKYGRLPLSKVIQPAIKLAKNGFYVSADLSKRLAYFEKNLKRSIDGKKIFFDSEGKPLRQDNKLVQTQLANTLKLIARHGNAGFYQGKIARAIAHDMKKYGGLISLSDLKSYQAEILEPIKGTFNQYTIYSMPPPSAGGIALIELLNILEQFPLAKYSSHSSENVHVMVEAMNYVYADRSQYLGDPKFVDIPINKLISKQYAKSIKQKIKLNRHTTSDEIPVKFNCLAESNQTTHYSVVDRDGNMVSNTYTLNSPFGNGHVVTNTGILLNNEMDDFAAKGCSPNQFGLISGNTNIVAPGKQPLSSMTPTIVLDKAGKPYIATGSPGGSRIITTVLQTVLNSLVFNMNAYDALTYPRFHSQWVPDYIRVEQPFSKKVTAELTKLGHKIQVNPSKMGSVQTVMRKDNKVYGASDPRRDGLAVGY